MKKKIKKILYQWGLGFLFAIGLVIAAAETAGHWYINFAGLLCLWLAVHFGRKYEDLI